MIIFDRTSPTWIFFNLQNNFFLTILTGLNRVFIYTRKLSVVNTESRELQISKEKLISAQNV